MRLPIFVCGMLLAGSASASNFELLSTSFNSTDQMPRTFTCQGQDQSPEINWSHAPTGTKAYALVMSDPDAPSGTWYHWIVYNIPSSTTTFDAGISEFPTGTQLGDNSWNNPKYNGPCPPAGAAHHYVFTLYALKSPLNLPKNASAVDVEKASQQNMLDKTEIVTTYARKS